MKNMSVKWLGVVILSWIGTSLPAENYYDYPGFITLIDWKIRNLVDNLMYVTPNGSHQLGFYDRKQYSEKQLLEALTGQPGLVPPTGAREFSLRVATHPRVIFGGKNSVSRAFNQFVDLRYLPIDGKRSFREEGGLPDSLHGIDCTKITSPRPEDWPKRVRFLLLQDYAEASALISDPKNLAIYADLPRFMIEGTSPDCCESVFDFHVFRGDGLYVKLSFNYSD